MREIYSKTTVNKVCGIVLGPGTKSSDLRDVDETGVVIGNHHPVTSLLRTLQTFLHPRARAVVELVAFNDYSCR